jgi:hypothetical protein
MLYLASRRDNARQRLRTALMPQLEPLLLTYLRLAEASQMRRQLLVRDKLLVLSGMTALELGWKEVAASCRQRILLHNPRHMIRRWPDLATAARAERFRLYLKQVRRNYSPERAEHMLHSLGISIDDAPESDRRPRERARAIVDSLVAEPGDDPAIGTLPQHDSLLLARQESASSSARFASSPLSAASWWPFWLGLVVWVVLALIVAFGRSWTV